MSKILRLFNVGYVCFRLMLFWPLMWPIILFLILTLAHEAYWAFVIGMVYVNQGISERYKQYRRYFVLFCRNRNIPAIKDEYVTGPPCQRALIRQAAKDAGCFDKLTHGT